MLKDRQRIVERLAANARLKRQMVQEYGDFLRTLFVIGAWFVTITFRDAHQDSDEKVSLGRRNFRASNPNCKSGKNSTSIYVKCAPDPRLETWEPDSKYRPKSGPPVRDAALREIEHWLLELGWEAAGHTRQEIFNQLADGLNGKERKNFARAIARKCLCCEIIKDPVTFAFFFKIHAIATASIGWVIAEEFGRLGGRWHVHLLIRGVQQLRRKKWWKRGFVRFGRTKIEPIHE
jgi:hypothetical protein